MKRTFKDFLQEKGNRIRASLTKTFFPKYVKKLREVEKQKFNTKAAEILANNPNHIRNSEYASARPSVASIFS